ncbi:MAG TPA: hypothetical protein VGB77_00785 [Abditibacteriaceae bacterium]|jgi:hypothetical protein
MKHILSANFWRRSNLVSLLISATIIWTSPISLADSTTTSKERPKLSLTDFLSSSEKTRLRFLAQKTTRTSGEEIELAALMSTARKRATVLVDLAQKENRRRPVLEKLQKNLQGQLQTRIFLDDSDGRQFEALLRKKQRDNAEQAALQKLMLVGSQNYNLVLNIARKQDRTEKETETLQRYGELAKRNSTHIKAFGAELLSELVDLQNQLAALFLLDDSESKRIEALLSKRSRTAIENEQLANLRKNSTTRFAEFLSLSQKPTLSETEKAKLALLREQVIRNAPGISQLMDTEYEEIQRLSAQVGGSTTFKPLPAIKASVDSNPTRPPRKTVTKLSSPSSAPRQKAPPVQARPGTIINLCPHIKIVGVSFAPTSASTYNVSYRWLNGGNRSVTAFEIVTLPYDTFNDQRRVIASMVRSQEKAPFSPGALGTQNVTLSGEKDIYTAVGYIRRVRLSDGTIWQVDEATLRNSIKKSVPSLKQIGRIFP